MSVRFTMGLEGDHFYVDLVISVAELNCQIPINLTVNPVVTRSGRRACVAGKSGAPEIMFAVQPGKLYVVATPIGNLGDLTIRARDTLAAVDVIACEDTRHSLTLLQHYEIRKPLVSLHEHNEAMRSAQLIEELQAGRTVACISDAGMPGVSDPGQRFVAACYRAGVPVEILPGASAVTTALIGSGMAADRFHFGGFLPVKKGQRERALRAALEREETTVFFESPHRIDGTLTLLAGIAPEHRICVARELTKKFEEYRRGSAAEVLAHYQKKPAKGEICLVLAGTDIPKWARNDPGSPDSEGNDEPEDEESGD